MRERLDDLRYLLRTRRGRAGIVALIIAGAAVWSFALRGDDAGPEREPDPKRAGRERPEPVTDDPLVRKMSVDEQVDQVLMVGFEGTGPDAPIVAEVGDEPPGALLIGEENWTGRSDGERLIAAIEKAGSGGERIPPLIVGSQEGGEFRSFPDLPPGKRELDIAREGSGGDVVEWAQETSAAMKSAGFHLNLFPVADIATLDSPLAGRAFSDDPAQAATLTESALEGCAEAEFACAPLHFPGLGAASQDTAEGPATISLDLATLQSRDLLAFTGTEARKAPAMVISLGLYPEIDPVVPGALTPGIATDLLRRTAKFRGVAISDDLGAGAVQATYSTKEAAVAALAAGVDLIQIADPDDANGVAGALADAVESGDVPPKRLADAVERVLDLKRDLGLIEEE